MDSMQILSRLYDLLSQSTAEELSHAAKLTRANTELSKAINMLAAYKRKSERRGKNRTQPEDSELEEPSLKSSRRVVTSSNVMDKKLAELVLSKKYFKTNHDLSNYLKKTHIPIRIDAKDSRKRVLNKLQNWVNKQPQDKKRIAYDKLLRELGTNETSGWLGVIRSSQS